MLRPSASNLFFWLRHLPGQSGTKEQPFRFATLNLSKDSDVLWNLILVCVDGNAAPISFKPLLLVEIPSRPERLTNKQLFRFETLNLSKDNNVLWNLILVYVTEMLRPSASNLFFWLRYLPGNSGSQKSNLSGLRR